MIIKLGGFEADPSSVREVIKAVTETASRNEAIIHGTVSRPTGNPVMITSAPPD